VRIKGVAGKLGRDVRVFGLLRTPGRIGTIYSAR